ncbi:ATP-binding SpoIIE family protein phosphatase [Pontibacter russatus]|uniref:ATP-binding SpoIIE family protein phosphatase n=1 Tax=Pontibacter russatus TaxID=2694929 RepID=UPI0013797296|nr:ATP-binding SpoIIE family protein phosphatase [Pontibacter russatus]
MDASPHQRFLVPDKTYSSMARRDIARLTESYGFSAPDTGRVNIVISELVSNLAKHTSGGGELLVRPVGSPVAGLEILCLDNGPGMADPARMLQDGFSTYGSAGEGLGAIKRQSDEFDLFSQPGVGTVVLCRIFKSGKRKEQPNTQELYEVGYVLAPKPDETVCGDGLAMEQRGADLYMLALDGLGHGASAREAAAQAAGVFTASPATAPAQALRDIHAGIRQTRGAVGLAARISGATQTISYCGVGNIGGRIFAPGAGPAGTGYSGIVSYNGILGHNMPNTLNSRRLDWGRGNLLVLHSDGLKSRWDLAKFPLLSRHRAATIAAVLYKTNSRQTDDTLVVVCKGKA